MLDGLKVRIVKRILGKMIDVDLSNESEERDLDIIARKFVDGYLGDMSSCELLEVLRFFM